MEVGFCAVLCGLDAYRDFDEEFIEIGWALWPFFQSLSRFAATDLGTTNER